MEDGVTVNDSDKAGQKRQRDDGDEEDENDRPLKKPKLDCFLWDSPGLLGNADTPKKSPLYSANYLSPVDSAYSSYLGENGSFGVSPSSSGLFSPTGKGIFITTPDKQWPTLDHIRDLFRSNYKSLKDELEPRHGLADKLYATEILTDKDMESIKEEPSRSRRADIFIKSLVHSSKANIFGLTTKILNVFKDENLDYLLTSGKNNSGSHIKTLSMEPAVASNSEFIFISKLQFLAKGLEDNLEPRDIIDDLLVSGFISFIDHEDIYVTYPRQIRVKTLVEHVKRRGRKNFHLFEIALKATYPELASQLNNKQLDCILPPKEISLELTSCHATTIETNGRTRNSCISANMVELKLNTIGENTSSDVEMSTVIANNGALNLELEEEAMEIGSASILAFEYSSIRIKFSALSEETVAKFIDSFDEPTALQRLVNRIFPKQQLLLLREKDVQKIKIEFIVPESSLITKKCTCKLSKEIIVNYFSLIEQELKDVHTYLDVFSSSSVIDPFARQAFSQIKEDQSSPATKAEAFLRKLLTIPEKAICLFEKQLKASGQQDLLKTVTEMPTHNKDSTSTYHVGPMEVRRNLTFLMNEIEPKLFVSCFENTNIKTEDIISSDPRKTRCERFVKCMLKAGQSTIDKFIKDLKRQDMSFVLDVLCRKGNGNAGLSTEDIRKNLLNHYAYLVNEIEPTRLRQKLVQERVFKAPEFDEIFKVSTQRRGRVVWLLRKLLQKDPNSLLAFIDALKIANYTEIAAKILDVSEENVDCPFMMSTMNEGINDTAKSKEFAYAAEFLVKWTKEMPTETELQLSLHKAIYQTNEVDKAKYTEKWIQNQQECHEHNDELSSDTNKENKHPDSDDSGKDPYSKHVNVDDTSLDTTISWEIGEDHRTTGSFREKMPAKDEYHVQCEPQIVIQCCSKVTEDDREKKIDSDSASIPSTCSNGRNSPYHNEFEDITPCQSPDISLPINSLAADFCGPDHRQNFFLQFSPISPCGSGGTACNSDSLSPTQSPTSMRPRAVRSQPKSTYRGQRK